MKKRILALTAALLLIANGALAELIEGQKPDWLIAKIEDAYLKVAEVSQPEGFARLEGVMPNGTEPEIYFAPEDSESPIRFFYYTTGYGDPSVFFHYTCSYPDSEGATAYEQSLIGYFPIDETCFAACIISLYAPDGESYAAEKELLDYLKIAGEAIAFEPLERK